jgi:hypothetical protein
MPATPGKVKGDGKGWEKKDGLSRKERRAALQTEQAATTAKPAPAPAPTPAPAPAAPAASSAAIITVKAKQAGQSAMKMVKTPSDSSFEAFKKALGSKFDNLSDFAVKECGGSHISDDSSLWAALNSASQMKPAVLRVELAPQAPAPAPAPAPAATPQRAPAPAAAPSLTIKATQEGGSGACKVLKVPVAGATLQAVLAGLAAKFSADPAACSLSYKDSDGDNVDIDDDDVMADAVESAGAAGVLRVLVALAAGSSAPAAAPAAAARKPASAASSSAPAKQAARAKPAAAAADSSSSEEESSSSEEESAAAESSESESSESEDEAPPPKKAKKAAASDAPAVADPRRFTSIAIESKAIANNGLVATYNDPYVCMQQLVKFQKDPKEELHLNPTLTSYERKQVRDFAEEHGLKHQTLGEKNCPGRHIVVRSK